MQNREGRNRPTYNSSREKDELKELYEKTGGNINKC